MSSLALNDALIIGEDLPDWLADQRQTAAASLLKDGFPSKRDELWKYTRSDALAKFANSALGQTTTVDSAPLRAVSSQIAAEAEAVEARYKIVFINGLIDETASNLPAGITLTHAHSEENAVSQLAPPQGRSAALLLLNTAKPGSDLRLRVAADTAVSESLHIFHACAGEHALAQPRLRIDCEAGSVCNIVEHYLPAADSECMSNCAIQIDMAKGARLAHQRLQYHNRLALHVTRIDARLAEDAYLNSWTLDIGGALVRNDIHALLTGENAEVAMYGLYICNGKQHMDNHTVVEHVAGNTRSSEDYRGILREHSRAVFNGKVHVHKGADGSDSTQSNANLLLSDNAEIDTKPELEIYADDVKCAHGATVGQIDDMSLFYLRSRGIDQATAIQLLTYAFCREGLDVVESLPVRRRMEQLIANQIPDFSALELIE